jgi:hypothetical protein
MSSEQDAVELPVALVPGYLGISGTSQPRFPTSPTKEVQDVKQQGGRRAKNRGLASSERGVLVEEPEGLHSALPSSALPMLPDGLPWPLLGVAPEMPGPMVGGMQLDLRAYSGYEGALNGSMTLPTSAPMMRPLDMSMTTGGVSALLGGHNNFRDSPAYVVQTASDFDSLDKLDEQPACEERYIDDTHGLAIESLKEEVSRAYDLQVVQEQPDDGFETDDLQKDDLWQVKNTFLTFTPQVKPIRSVRTAEGALCSLDVDR